jgi:hypothetical protein
MNSALKELLGNMPGAATIYGAMRPGRPRTRYNLEQLAERLPAAVQETLPHVGVAQPGSRLLLFATLHYWIEQAAIVGLALRGLGNEVTIAYLPYGSWEKAINTLDLRRQDLYTRKVLAPLDGLIRVESLLEGGSSSELPQALQHAIVMQSQYDAMYSLQNEQVDQDSALYRLRLERNRAAMASALQLITKLDPDAVLIPNGLVTELGIFYQAARALGAPTVTYEFNDQREQIWLARDDIVMHQNTDRIWEIRRHQPLTDQQREKLAALEQARSGGRTYGKGTRQWQNAAAEGGEQVRRALELDSRPVVLLATNVLGDSLTLGRHVFATSMAEWLEATVRYFRSRPEVQLVVRVHPGERLMKGTSMMDVVQRLLSPGPGNIRVVGPSESVNTYDVMDVASLGLVYTTTAGMEMAMRGVPVVVAGKTHYRGRGFTKDPSSWDEYVAILNDSLIGLGSTHLSGEQVEMAWNYAYRFFFEYPFDFPWRLMHFWKDMDVWPIRRVLSDEGREIFGRTFRHLAGETIG